MDFTYHDTKDQKRFRQNVCTWLSANLPPVLHDPQTCRKQDATTWDACRVFQRRLGDQGWLAPTAPAAWGGGELAPSQAVVLLEELEKRGLRELVDDAGASLREALHACGTEAQQEQFLLAIARGQLLLWRTAVEPEIELDPSILGVDAWTDGDDYVLHGEGRFVGLGPGPTTYGLWR